MYYICYCYSYFIDPTKLNLISDNNVVLMTTFETHILYQFDFDIYNCCFESCNFSHDYWNLVGMGKKPIFEIFNKILQLCCKLYPSMLKGFTFAEEVVIARVYLVIIILKLRLNNVFNPGAYRGIYGYYML